MNLLPKKRSVHVALEEKIPGVLIDLLRRDENVANVDLTIGRRIRCGTTTPGTCELKMLPLPNFAFTSQYCRTPPRRISFAFASSRMNPEIFENLRKLRSLHSMPSAVSRDIFSHTQVAVMLQPSYVATPRFFFERCRG